MRHRSVIAAVLAALACGCAPPSEGPIERIERERASAAGQARHRPSPELGAARLAGARIDGAGLRAGAIALSLHSIGRPGSMRALDRDAPLAIEGPEVRLARAPGVIEWWRSLERGLEHGVTIDARPPGEGSLRLALSTGARCEAVSPDAIVLRDGQGRELARYAELLVVDAVGRPVSARMSARGEQIAIEIDDRRARYPLVVDPLLTGVEEAELIGTDSAPQDRIGESVALSGDGALAIVGAPGHGAFDTGGARVWVRSGTSWTLETTLLAPDTAPFDKLGAAVAASQDGSRVILGAPDDDVAGMINLGSARVFVRSGSAWSEEAALIAADGAVGDGFGAAVAMSDDGTRALVGAPRDDVGGVNRAGSARVFVRSGGSWTEEAMFIAPSATTFDELGTSVALSGDGTRALVGAPGADTVHGVSGGNARVYARSGATWTEEAVLVPASGDDGDSFGSSVALSADGSRALVGAPGASPSYVRTFTRAGTTWTEAPGPVPPVPFAATGGAIALTRDGTRALIGAPPSTTVSHPAYLYHHDGAGWVHVATIAPPAPEPADRFGTAVAIADDGSRVLAGASGKDAAGSGNIDRGRAHVFRLEPATADGAPCTSALQCASGFCADGVCCDSACTGRSCQACISALTGLNDGHCAPVMAGAVECRPAVGVCDVAEVCDGTSVRCPADASAPETTPCRAASGPCDVEDVCGPAGTCPNRRVPSGTLCREATDACDVAEACNGSSPSCPEDQRAPAGTECRAASGVCDVAETCPGGDGLCPDDALAGADVVCRAAAGACDVEERCEGTGPDCPADVSECALDAGPMPGDAGSVSIEDGGPASSDAGMAGLDGGATAPDAAAAIDAGARADAGAAPAETEVGCACRAGAGGGSSGGLLALVAIAAVAWRRRR